MICETCRYSGRPGFVFKLSGQPGSFYQLIAPGEYLIRHGRLACEVCPDCGGTAIAHCCDGLAEQPRQNPVNSVEIRQISPPWRHRATYPEAK